MKFTKPVVSSPLERLLLTVGRLVSGAAYKLGRELQGYKFGGLSLTLAGHHSHIFLEGTPMDSLACQARLVWRQALGPLLMYSLW